MDTNTAKSAYRIWGSDDVLYGPVDLTGLAEWVKDERVTLETWVFVEEQKNWVRAMDMPQLNLFFGSNLKGKPEALSRARELGVTPEALRRIKILAQMDVSQLERFIEFIDVMTVDFSGVVVTKGSPGDAMYLVLDGELRVRLIVSGKETLLATLSSGDFFGEMALLDQGPRSADVVANEQSMLLKISARAFERMKTEAPDVALPFLLNISRSVATRMRLLTNRYADSVHGAQFYTRK